MKNELPNNWVETNIKTVSNILRGVSYKKDEAYLEFFDSSIYILRGGNIQDEKIDFKTDDNVYVSKNLIQQNQLIKKDDVVIVGSTGSKKLIGKAGIADTDLPKVSFGAFLMLLRTNVINKKFHSYFFQTLYYRNSISSLAGGVNINNIKKEHLENLIFPLPPLPEQERIITKLDTLFAQYEAMKKALEHIPLLLKDFRQQVLTKAVTGELTPFIKYEYIKLNDLGIWKGGGTPSKANSSFWENGTVLWITPKDMKDLFLSNSLDKITNSAVQSSSAILIPKNSILIVTRSGILRRILPISSNSIETTVNQDLKVLIPNDKVNYKFLLYALKGLEKDIRMTCMKNGTTVESIEFSLLKNYKINLPNLQVQQETINRVESLFEKADIIEKRYKALKGKIDSLPQAILHKAFKGELVPQLPTDGDAKDLLKEILKLKSEVKKK